MSDSQPKGGPPTLTAGARLVQFSRGMVDRISGLWGPAGDKPPQPKTEPMVYQQPNQPQPFGVSTADGSVRREPWFGPGKPMTPVAPRQDVAGRAWDYPVSRNMWTTPRQGVDTGITFDQLSNLANYDMVRLAIETRKDQMSKLEWSILPKIAAGQETRPAADDRCVQLEQFLQRPDRRLPWHAWKRQLMEQQLAYDAASIYVRRTVGGDVYSLEVVDGRTIIPILDGTGRQPLAPDPAYQQILKGLPAIDYTCEELIYAPRNPRVGHVYGLSVVEQIVLTVNVAIRREVSRLNYFTEGNIPEALVTTPKDWTPDHILRFQTMWDAVMSDPANRKGKLKFIPAEANYIPTRTDQALMDTFDEWLARVILYAFSLPALPFVRQQNRATAETANETALEEGLQPNMLWFKSMMDRIIQDVFNYKDLEFVYDTIDKLDPVEQQQRDLQDMQAGLLSMDQVLANRGLPKIGMSNAIWGGPNGVIFISDLIKAQQQGLTAIQPPMPPMMPGAVPGQPGFVDGPMSPMQPALPGGEGAPAMQQAVPEGAGAPLGQQVGSGSAGAPSLTDALAGIPPQLLSAVGLGTQGVDGRTVDVTDRDHDQSDPLAHLVPHPQVLRTLREAERRNGRKRK